MILRRSEKKQSTFVSLRESSRKLSCIFLHGLWKILESYCGDMQVHGSFILQRQLGAQSKFCYDEVLFFSRTFHSDLQKVSFGKIVGDYVKIRFFDSL